MKNKAYYHIYMPDDDSWSYIFIDQMSKLIDSGLVNKLSNLHVVCIGNMKSINHMKGLLSYYNSVTGLNITLTLFEKTISDNYLHKLDVVENKSILSETQTLKIIRDDCITSNEPFNVLYFHAKAVTSIEKALKTGQYNRFVNFVHWRKLLDYFVIEKHTECIKKLNDGFNTASTNFCEWPSKHYSGNYWWATSDYIKTLNDSNDTLWWDSYKSKHQDLYRLPDRLVAEMWIGSGDNPRMYSSFSDPLRPPISNLGDRFILGLEYYK
ncbi:hypothetical protein M0R04_05145 [Candidatus Dojkabacteria bacterium]|jgi:hypothetical protein|nr:hypothetical protein [Candidatus Dojkabacteria bacterium]